MVVLLFKLAQIEAIRNKTSISIKIIDKIAKERFVLLEPMLDSMRRFTQGPLEYEKQCMKKEAKLYEDLLYKVTTQPGVPISEQPPVRSKSRELDLTFKSLKQMGYEKSLFEPFVLSLFAQDPSLTADIAVKEFMVGVEEADPQKPPTRRSLQEITEAAIASGKTPLEGLQEAGLSPRKKMHVGSRRRKT
ncbi:hypothetical protein [Geomonas ferrireducens]|uniref:hypothetical protein n=1 Tax=Geomonas ferrireducens TaxID=2570227 RepID=UPI001FECB1FE|nr:hypothetical protein [Geomonas ferrireducens]